MEPQQPAPDVPGYQQYMEPLLAVLREASGPMPNDELNHAVAARMALGPDVLAVLHDPERSDQPEAFYRMAWSRTYLKKVGLLDNPRRGVWAITEQGGKAQSIDPDRIARQVREGADADVLSVEVPEHLAEELMNIVQSGLAEGRVSAGELDACYLGFRQKFGPQVLKNLDGEQLLTTLHGRGTKDSLVYWLEFKDDDELPRLFGSIAGGSALKFGIYQSAETGDWMTGHASKQRRLAPHEAVELVRSQRDQLVAGGELVAALEAAGTVNYETLQQALEQAAPDLANTGWGHKYFSLMAPTVLDPYHTVDYQKYHLIRVHKVPTDSRYENARFFAGIADQLGIPIVHLANALKRRHGSPRTYWRIGTSAGGDGPSEWPFMRDGGYASVGWSAVGPLTEVERSKAGKDHVRGLVDRHYPANASVVTRGANELFHFATTAQSGDVVVAMRGATVLGVGEINGSYYYEEEEGRFPHRLPVRWRSRGEWKMARAERLRTTFAKLGRYPANLVEVERRLDSPGDLPQAPKAVMSRTSPSRPTAPRLEGMEARIEAALARKAQVILYGPPGTGKTYWAERAVHELAAHSWFSTSYGDLSPDQREQLRARGVVDKCCFHPAYGYEDFLIGYRPVATDGKLAFEPRRGIFAALCERASATPDKRFYLMIDEINRGDIPRIFGELLTVLEKDKRGKPITLPLTGEDLVVPPNVFVVGTMNTADRSVALLDAALRRRFAFIELMPDPLVLGGTNVAGLALGPWLAELNRRIVRHVGRDARNLQIGHSYLLRGGGPVEDAGRFVELLRDDIIPLLQEYCYEDFDALEKILGGTIVLREEQRFNEALLHPSRRHDLIEALLISFDVIAATSGAVEADADGPEDTTDEVDDDDPGDEPPS